MNYSVINFPNDIIQDILRNKENILTKGNINDASGLTKRNSSVSWIKNPDICQRVFGVMKNRVADFSSLYIDNIEPLQYSEYDTSQEYGWHQDLNNKPYPDCYNLAVKKLDIKPSQCIIVEDSPKGMQSAKSSVVPDSNIWNVKNTTEVTLENFRRFENENFNTDGGRRLKIR